jgi:hypothetical protein
MILQCCKISGVKRKKDIKKKADFEPAFSSLCITVYLYY